MKTYGLWTVCIIIFPLIAVYVECASLSNVVFVACQRNPNLKICSSRSRHSSSAEDFPDSEPPPLPPPIKVRRPLLSVSRLPGNLTRSEFLLLRQLASQTRRFRNPFADEGNLLLDEDIVDFSSKEDTVDKFRTKPTGRLSLTKEDNDGSDFPDIEGKAKSISAGDTSATTQDTDGSNFPDIEGKAKSISTGDSSISTTTEDNDGSNFPDINRSSKRTRGPTADKEDIDGSDFPDIEGKSKSSSSSGSHRGIKEDVDELNWHKEDDEDSTTTTATSEPWHKEGEEEPDTVLTRGGNFARTNDEDAKTRVEAYCEKYQENYDYYCQDSIDKTPALKTHLLKFCPSFEANCPDKIKKKPGTPSVTSFPIKTPATTDNTEEFPDVLNVVKTPEEIAADERLAKLKKRFPCKPDCNPRIHKHCTAECKCDYLYPHVQRFCNPPPIPFFLNTCRLWYYGCPKYQGYHYASQFVYSKAEKGKTVGGVSPRIGGYGGATPTGFGGGTGPIAGINPTAPVVGLNPALARDDLTKAVKPERAKLIARNKPTNPFETAQQEFLKEQNIRPKARQATTGAVDPAASTSVHDFDQFSDRRGQVLRARSRSPFSKPGLWEPNPDDPHNRDHANKWYYRPSSVGADWLSGQVTWGAHWAVPAAGVGGTDGFSAVHFPTIGNFFNIADDYD